MADSCLSALPQLEQIQGENHQVLRTAALLALLAPGRDGGRKNPINMP